MANQFKKIKRLMLQRFDAIEADIKAIQINQSHINRRLEAIEAKLDKTNKFYALHARIERPSDD